MLWEQEPQASVSTAFSNVHVSVHTKAYQADKAWMEKRLSYTQSIV